MMSTLDVQEWLSRNSPRTCDAASISQPVRLGHGWTKSCEQTAQYSHNDFSGLPALKMPSTPVDLNKGLENYVPKRDDVKAGVEILIRESFAAGAPLEKCEIISFRNNLNKILGTVFDLDSPWAVDATTRSGSEEPSVVFLDIVKMEERSFGNDSSPFVAWGYNFEAICTGESYADPNSEYGMLLNFKLGRNNSNQGTPSNAKFSIYLGAEIDAYDPLELPPEHDVQSIPPISSLTEIKTFTRPVHEGQWMTTFRFRFPKWWLQSFLAGVPALILGARDKKGIVHEIHHLATAELPRMAREKGCTWSAQQALAFGSDALGWMAAVCRSTEYVNKHVRFEYDPRRRSISAIVIEDGDLPGRITAAFIQLQAAE